MNRLKKIRELDLYPEASGLQKIDVVDCWEADEIIFTILFCKQDKLVSKIMRDQRGGWHTGYCRFRKRPLAEKKYGGIVVYVPVHGGITYAKEDEMGFTYGFDCHHAGDETKPHLANIDWLRDECQRMAVGIKIAALFEKQYLKLGEDSDGKANLLDQYHEKLKKLDIGFNLTDNFGAMIRLLSGNL